MTEDLREAARDRPEFRAARQRVEDATAKRDGVASEVESLEAEIVELEAELEDATETGDPDGAVRRLAASRRELGERLEDVRADLEAQEAAVAGARRAQHRALLEAMPAVWEEQPREETEERVREAVTALLAALDALDALERGHRQLADLGRHVVGRLLDGKADVPRLAKPDPGIAPNKLAELTRAVRSAARDTPEQTEEVAA